MRQYVPSICTKSKCGGVLHRVGGAHGIWARRKRDRDASELHCLEESHSPLCPTCGSVREGTRLVDGESCRLWGAYGEVVRYEGPRSDMSVHCRVLLRCCGGGCVGL